MQHQLEPPTAPASSAGHLAEDLYALLTVVKRGWRYVAVSTATFLALGLTYAYLSKTTYQAAARLLVLEQGGRLLPGGNVGSLQSVRGGEDSLATQVMIFRSPIVVQRALMFINERLKDEYKTIPAETTAALKSLSTEAVMEHLTVTVPDPSAKVLHVVYTAGTPNEAAEVMAALITSYEDFLKNSYQKNTNKTIELFRKARDELSDRIAKMEKDYKDYREKSPPYTTDEGGRSILARRLDQWEQVGNQARVRSLELRSQLELGRKLVSEGADAAKLTATLSRLGSVTDRASGAEARLEGGRSAGLGYAELEVQLEDVASERSTVARQLDHLRADRDEAVASRAVSNEEVARVFEAEPETIGLRSDIAKAKTRYDQATRLSRKSDPVVSKAQERIKDLQKSLSELWRRRGPAIADQLARASTEDAIHTTEAHLAALSARESALRETVAQAKQNRLDEARQERERLVKLNVPNDPRVRQLDELIARLEENPGAASGNGQSKVEGVLGSIEQSLQAVETLQKRIQDQFDRDLVEAKKAEVGIIAESNLRKDLERQRALFNSVVDQLDRTELVSDYSSTTSQTINPPTVRVSRPMRALVILAGLLVGVVVGSGMAFVKDQLDTRIRSLTAMRRALNISVLGIVPALTREQREASGTLGLICHSLPRSFISESYKVIRTNFEFIRRNLNAVVVVVTSPQNSDGKSTTARNLAISLAHAGRKVLLVDADLRNPSINEMYGKGRERGLPHALKDLLPLHLASQPSQVENLDLLLAGPEVSNPAELLASHQLVKTLEEMRLAYDVVILDSPPLLVVADASILAQVADGILLVVRTTFTSRPDVDQTVELLKTLKTPVLGAVINGIPQEELGSRYGGYGKGAIYGQYPLIDESGENELGDTAVPLGINGTVHR